MSASIKFVKEHSNKVIYLSHGASLQSVSDFAQYLDQYTNASITRISQTNAMELGTEEGSGDYGVIEFYAHILLRCMEDGELYGVNIPAPVASMFEQVEGRGWRVKQAIGDAIAAEYARLSGLTIEFHDSALLTPRY